MMIPPAGEKPKPYSKWKDKTFRNEFYRIWRNERREWLRAYNKHYMREYRARKKMENNAKVS